VLRAAPFEGSSRGDAYPEGVAAGHRGYAAAVVLRRKCANTIGTVRPADRVTGLDDAEVNVVIPSDTADGSHTHVEDDKRNQSA
jgi:hypothetical protein